MSNYKVSNQIRKSLSLAERVAACAAEQGISSPEAWVESAKWKYAVLADWVAAWDYAVNSDGHRNGDSNPDTGARPVVITDVMILSFVQMQNGVGLD